MVVVKVTNKNNTPYGVLSIGYRDNIFINNKIHNSIIDYMTSDYDVKLSQPYSLSLNNVWVSMEKNLINKAFKEGIESKLKTNPFFEDELLKTENKNIVYLSQSDVFGVNRYTKTGENLYGIWLNFYRNNLIENSGKIFYDKYILERLLNFAIYSEPLDNYLEMAKNGYGINHIKNILYDKYNKFIDLPSREIVENIRQMNKNNIYNLDDNIHDIILNVMKKKIRDVRITNLKKLKSKIFTIFITNVFKKNNITYDVSSFIKKLEPNEYLYSTDRVFENYMNINSNNISNSEFYIPTEQEITKIEEYTANNKNLVDKNYQQPGNVFYVEENSSFLSVLNDTYLFDVNGKQFPTIYHYVIYCVGSLIIGMEPYNMIFDFQNNSFFRLEDSKRFLKENIIKFKDFYFRQKLIEGLTAKINQKPYVIDYLKSLGDHTLKISDLYQEETEKFYEDVRKKIKWNTIFEQRGNVIDYLDSDNFFIFIQREMFNSFINILNITTPTNYTHKNILSIYENFYGNIPGTISSKNIIDKINVNFNNIKKFSLDLGLNISDQSCEFLKLKFTERILNAEELATSVFGNTKILYLTKFLIIESRYKISQGSFLDEKRIYPTIYSKYNFALAKILNSVSICNNIKKTTKENIDKSYEILTTSSDLNYLKINDFLQENNKLIDDYFTNENNDNINYEEDEGEEPINIDYGGIEEDQEDVYDDLMYAPSGEYMNSDEMTMLILSNLNTDEETLKYFNKRCKDLFQDPNKNNYKINLYQ